VTVAVDHRHAQSAVRDQAERRACVGFAVSAAHEWVNPRDDLASPEDALWAAHQEGGPPDREDTSIKLALVGLSDHGHADEAAWPFGNPAWPASRPASAQDAERQRTLRAWRQIKNPEFDSLAGELTSGHAVLLSLHVVLDAWRDTSGLVDIVPGAPVIGGHAVLAVGVDEAEDGRIIFKNSWGTTWGDAGYGYLTNRYLAQHLKRAFVLEAP
jgi:C1A family cysteine protease